MAYPLPPAAPPGSAALHWQCMHPQQQAVNTAIACGASPERMQLMQ